MASTPVAIDTGIALSDADNATLASATVQIGAGFVASEDLLGFNNDGLTMGNIAAPYDAAHGTLTLTSAGGTATLAQWQAALRAVTYTNTAITPDAATRSIGIAVNDGAQASAVFSRDVAITAVRQTPHLSDDGASPVYTASQDASPVAVGTGMAARHNILIKDAATLEGLSAIDGDDIGSVGDCLATGGGDIGDDGIGGGGRGAAAIKGDADIIDDDRRAGGSQSQGVAAAEAAPGAGDDSDLAGQVGLTGHWRTPCWS